MSNLNHYVRQLRPRTESYIPHVDRIQDLLSEGVVGKYNKGDVAEAILGAAVAAKFIIRPVGVFLSTVNSTLKFNEKLFISWVGPRGIVAAGIASLFGLKLASKGVPGAEYITPLVFVIVLGTVLLNACLLYTSPSPRDS